MNKTLIILTIICLPFLAEAQIQFKGTATGKHKRALDQVDQTRKEIRQARREARKARKRQKELREAMGDSAFRQQHDSLGFVQRIQYYEAKLDPADLGIVSDSLAAYEDWYYDTYGLDSAGSSLAS